MIVPGLKLAASGLGETSCRLEIEGRVSIVLAQTRAGPVLHPKGPQPGTGPSEEGVRRTYAIVWDGCQVSSCEAHADSGLAPPGWSSSACMFGRPPYAAPAVMRAGVGVLEGARPPAFHLPEENRAHRLSTAYRNPPARTTGDCSRFADVSTRRHAAAAWMFSRLDRAMLYPVSAALRRRRSVCPRRIGPFGDRRRVACLSAYGVFRYIGTEGRCARRKSASAGASPAPLLPGWEKGSVDRA